MPKFAKTPWVQKRKTCAISVAQFFYMRLIREGHDTFQYVQCVYLRLLKLIEIVLVCFEWQGGLLRFFSGS